MIFAALHGWLNWTWLYEGCDWAWFRVLPVGRYAQLTWSGIAGEYSAILRTIQTTLTAVYVLMEYVAFEESEDLLADDVEGIGRCSELERVVDGEVLAFDLKNIESDGVPGGR
jgi:hypothetical protein